MNPKIAELVKEYEVSGSSGTLMTIWECFRPLVMGSMRKFYVSKEDYEDVCQEAFIQLFRCLETYDIHRAVSFEGYYKIQLNYWFFNQARKKTELLVVDHHWSEGVSMTNFMESDMGKGLEEVQAKEDNLALQRALEQLTFKQRQAVTLFCVHKVCLSDVAKQIGCSYRVAFKHKDAGLKNLKRLLQADLKDIPP